MLYGCGSYAFPPEYKPSIIALRKWMRQGRRKITREMLGECEADIRKAYLDLSRSLFRLPTLCNTDGEPFDMQTLHYEIDSAEWAFDGLAGLCVTESEAELRALAERDAQGAVTRVEIPWTRKGRDKSGLDTTVLGILNIEGKTLRVTVNSAARAERTRKEIESRLGAGARFKTAVIQSGEVMMKEARDRASRPAPPRKDEDLMRNPEVRAKLAEMVAAHWKNWVNQKIPALGGKTPRQAAKTNEGRESVEALLRSAERRARRDENLGQEIAHGGRGCAAAAQPARALSGVFGLSAGILQARIRGWVSPSATCVRIKIGEKVSCHGSGEPQSHRPLWSIRNQKAFLLKLSQKFSSGAFSHA